MRVLEIRQGFESRVVSDNDEVLNGADRPTVDLLCRSTIGKLRVRLDVGCAAQFVLVPRDQLSVASHD